MITIIIPIIHQCSVHVQTTPTRPQSPAGNAQAGPSSSPRPLVRSRLQGPTAKRLACLDWIRPNLRLKLGLYRSLRIRVVDGLVNTNHPQEVVLDDAQIEQYPVGVPRNSAYHGSSNRIEDEVICRGDDCRQDERRVRHAQGNN